jgi:hypothetical protein
MSLFRMHLVLLSASCYIWSLLYFYYFVFWYFFSISFWFILMFFHLIILNIFLLFIATDLLLVIVNICLKRHLPHGLLLVIANSTSILHACIEWFLVYELCFILLFCVLIFFSISFWFILMFFHYWLFLTYFCFFIANSCLERHLSPGLLFVIANSTSVLHVCLNVFAMILCSAWHKLLCLYLYSRFKSTLGLMLICRLCIYIYRL